MLDNGKLTVHHWSICCSCFRYAFAEFASEAMADKNHKLLQGAKIKDHELIVDYVGKKSSFKPVQRETGKGSAVAAHRQAVGI